MEVPSKEQPTYTSTLCKESIQTILDMLEDGQANGSFAHLLESDGTHYSISVGEGETKIDGLPQEYIDKLQGNCQSWSPKTHLREIEQFDDITIHRGNAYCVLYIAFLRKYIKIYLDEYNIPTVYKNISIMDKDTAFSTIMSDINNGYEVMVVTTYQIEKFCEKEDKRDVIAEGTIKFRNGINIETYDSEESDISDFEIDAVYSGSSGSDCKILAKPHISEIQSIKELEEEEIDSILGYVSDESDDCIPSEETINLVANFWLEEEEEETIGCADLEEAMSFNTEDTWLIQQKIGYIATQAENGYFDTSGSESSNSDNDEDYLMSLIRDVLQ